MLFSESQGRILVSVLPENVAKFEKIMTAISCTKIGKVTKNSKFEISNAKNKSLIKTNIKNLFKNYHSFSEKMK